MSAGRSRGLPSSVKDLLAAAVADIGGTERPGQVDMAQAVARSIETGEHLVVQAGTGTGKSLAYLVPALRHAVSRAEAVVVSTATIALQRQLIERDLPRLAATLRPPLGREPTFAILKGRRNYLCLLRAGGGASAGGAEQTGLFNPADVSFSATQAGRIREWAGTTSTGDRDELRPGVDDRMWRQFSVSAQECIGAQRCPFGEQCFAERAREVAARTDIVVTNHAMLAIDAVTDYDVLPEHHVVIVDEAHDLVDRVTTAASAEVSAVAVEAAARRCAKLVEDKLIGPLQESGEALRRLLAQMSDGRLDDLAEPLAASLAAVRDAAVACAASLRADTDDPEAAAAARLAEAGLDAIAGAGQRALTAFDADVAARTDVVWLERPSSVQDGPETIRVAPLEVSGLLADRLFRRRTVVLTSATLAVGGSFGPLAKRWGLADAGGSAAGPADASPSTWSGVDVGSPFDHRRSAILYVAAHLPRPGREGLQPEYLAELRDLILAAGGRTLGLFSSLRAARQAAAQLRPLLGLPLFCQGDDATGLLVQQFAADETACLFGTISLWQGVDVPGSSLQLVVIDRIPFPRPDDPLTSARQRAVSLRGGDGFMDVAAPHAALLLAQGSGRLLRTLSDRGVVAVLDPRLVTARYGGYLLRSLPRFAQTTKPDVVRDALRRLDVAAGCPTAPPTARRDRDVALPG